MCKYTTQFYLQYNECLETVCPVPVLCVFTLISSAAVSYGIVVAATTDIDDGVADSSKQRAPDVHGIVTVFVTEFMCNALQDYSNKNRLWLTAASTTSYLSVS